MICGLPGMQLFDSLGVDGDGNVVVATLVTGALTVISPAGEVLDQVMLGDRWSPTSASAATTCAPRTQRSRPAAAS
jgi:sugar lactone lactonase YvrE